jgi:hypothetical protein
LFFRSAILNKAHLWYRDSRGKQHFFTKLSHPYRVPQLAQQAPFDGRMISIYVATKDTKLNHNIVIKCVGIPIRLLCDGHLFGREPNRNILLIVIDKVPYYGRDLKHDPLGRGVQARIQLDNFLKNL